MRVRVVALRVRDSALVLVTVYRHSPMCTWDAPAPAYNEQAWCARAQSEEPCPACLGDLDLDVAGGLVALPHGARENRPQRGTWRFLRFPLSSLSTPEPPGANVLSCVFLGRGVLFWGAQTVCAVVVAFFSGLYISFFIEFYKSAAHTRAHGTLKALKRSDEASGSARSKRVGYTYTPSQT